LESAAEAKPWQETPTLLSMLGDRRSRPHARRALAAFGEPILPRLSELARDRGFDLKVRRQLPRVMSVIGGQRAADLLVDHLKGSDYELSYNALDALSRIRRLQSTVRFDREAISQLLVGRLREYYQEVVWLDGIPTNGDKMGSRFLRRALKERLRRKTDETFQLLALIYPRREMLDAYHWIASGRVDLRSNALEFLDSRLDNPVREMLLPVVEDRDGQRVLRAGRELFGLRPLPYPSVLRSLLHLPDTWLQACASYVAAEDGIVDLRQRLRELAGHADPVLREAATAAQTRLTARYPAAGP
jgi:hypothetical protein